MCVCSMFYQTGFIVLHLVSHILCYKHTYPGTNTRPILSPSEASQVTIQNYLQGWFPESIVFSSSPDYIVGSDQDYTDIQVAANLKFTGMCVCSIFYQTGFIVLHLVSHILCYKHAYPGINTRPILSLSEASQVTIQNYLQGWFPESIVFPSSPDYIVGSDQDYTDIQVAINDAIQTGGTTRRYIRIEPGTYNQTIYISFSSVPLTLYGGGRSPDEVQIVLSQGANMNGTTYANQINCNGSRYKFGDPAWSMYNECFRRPTIGTSCSSIFWIRSDSVEIANLLIENPSTDGQAVAVQTDGDKINFENVHFIGFQDTLFASGDRVYFNNVFVTGDVDFVFGDASAVFQSSIFYARADRPRKQALVFAPKTAATRKYGYLVIQSYITGDGTYLEDKGVSLARAWDSAPYQPNITANGQLVIRESRIDDVINVNSPYSTSTGSRPFTGNANTNRDINDNNFNRFWEYNNTGDGA